MSRKEESSLSPLVLQLAPPLLHLNYSMSPSTELGQAGPMRGQLASGELQVALLESRPLPKRQCYSSDENLSDGVVLTHLYSFWIGFLYTVLGWVRV